MGGRCPRFLQTIDARMNAPFEINSAEHPKMTPLSSMSREFYAQSDHVRLTASIGRPCAVRSSPHCGALGPARYRMRRSLIGEDSPNGTCHSLGCPRIFVAWLVEKLYVSLGGSEVAAAARLVPSRAAVSQAVRAVCLKLRPPGRSDAGSSSQTSTTSNLQRAHCLRPNPSPIFFLFTLTFRSNHGSLRFQAPFRPLWQEGDAYVVVLSCHTATCELTHARSL